MLTPNDHEIESLEEFDRVVASGSLCGHRVQSVDLTTRTRVLIAADTAEAVFLGCPMEPQAAAHVRLAPFGRETAGQPGTAARTELR